MKRNWQEQVEDAVKDFIEVANLAHEPLSPRELKASFLVAGEHPNAGLPKGQMAVYGFWGDGEWLKIGKAGPNSNARFRSHHYDATRSKSTLAGSLKKCPRMPSVAEFDAADPGRWIREHTCRFNILIPKDKRGELLSLLEAFLHTRLRPRYEQQSQLRQI